VKLTQQRFLTAHFGASGPKYSQTSFKTERVDGTALRASWFWGSLAGFPGTWGVFSRPRDYKVTTDGLGLQRNGHRENDRTLGFKLLARNIAALHFKTERVAETALRASWFWATLAQFAGTWGIFSNLGDSKLTTDGLDLQWNGHRKIFWTISFKLLGWNIAPLHYQTEGVAETSLRASWFWRTSARFPRAGGIFSSPGDSKLTPDGLG